MQRRRCGPAVGEGGAVEGAADGAVSGGPDEVVGF